MDFFNKFKSLIKPYFGRIRFLLTLTLIFELLKLINPYIFKLIIDNLVKFDQTAIERLMFLTALLLLTNVVVSWIYRWIDLKRFDFMLSLERYLPNLAYQKLLGLSLGYHEKENTGNKIQKIRRGMDQLNQLIASAFWDLFPILFQALVTFIFILVIDWPLAFVFISTMPFYFWATYRLNRKIAPLRNDVNQRYEESAGLMGQSIININTVQSYAQQDYEIKSHYSVLDRIFNLENRIWAKILDFNFIRNTMIDVGRVLTMGFAIFQTAAGSISAGTLVLFLTLSERVYTSLGRISRIYDRAMETIPAINRLDSLLRTESEIKSPDNPVKLDITGAIEFKGVCFAYTGQTPALSDVSFKITPGEFIALVGPSGAGKTTIVKLLYRHFDISAGQILFNGIDVKKIDLYHLRRQLGIVTQDVDIFNDTIAANIAYARPTASEQEIKKAAVIANAHDFIMATRDGYQTLVGERGVKLSGGQKQRIGIARAILNNPKILIFDEATSSLDSESETMIQRSIFEISKNRTLIVIAHRLSTIRKASRILVLESGRLVESGTHEHLTTSHGLYAKLHDLQMAGDVR